MSYKDVSTLWQQKQDAKPGRGSVHFPQQGGQAAPESSENRPFVAVRRHQVEALLRDGRSNREIGTQLGVSESIVKKDVQAICARAGVDNTREYFAKLLQKLSLKGSETA